MFHVSTDFMARAHSQSPHQAIEALDAAVSLIQFVAKRERAIVRDGIAQFGRVPEGSDDGKTEALRTAKTPGDEANCPRALTT